MPAWMTSEFLDDVSLPNDWCCSRIKTSLPCSRDSSLAIAKPTTPAPITTTSTFSMRDYQPGTSRSLEADQASSTWAHVNMYANAHLRTLNLYRDYQETRV
mmetsp:Transcript_3883/g.5486  ORF Transcript_3883/g.5486 Transcript_3883/m.5486 type:complete len:101 (-) Transcript_3883:376-678(-)